MIIENISRILICISLVFTPFIVFVLKILMFSALLISLGRLFQCVGVLTLEKCFLASVLDVGILTFHGSLLILVSCSECSDASLNHVAGSTSSLW